MGFQLTTGERAAEVKGFDTLSLVAGFQVRQKHYPTLSERRDLTIDHES